MNVLDSILKTQEFATLPPVAAKVLKLLEDDNIDVRDIAKVIETDAPLTIKLLRVANSPLYAVRNEVTSVQGAILTLGLNRLTNIVLGVSIFSKFLNLTRGPAAMLMKKFWWHSSCTGIVAKSLAKRVNPHFKENEFIGGLLHDIGKLALLQFDPDKYSKVVATIEQGDITDVEAENEVFGVDHIIAGEAIAKTWKLPQEIITIVAQHSTPDTNPNFRELVAVVRFADLLCEIWGAGFYEGIPLINYQTEPSWNVLIQYHPELADLDIEAFTFELEDEFKKGTAFLNIISEESTLK